jgi:acyl dehydratase
MNFRELAVGSERAPMSLGPLTRTDFVRYQGASGDMVPVHHDEEFARAAGYSAPLGVGMFHAGVAAAWAAEWLGPENVRRFRVRWKAQVWPGDVLRFTGKVVKTFEEAGEGRVEVELRCERQTGDLALEAWMSFALRL